jgi:hypothetical protein
MPARLSVMPALEARIHANATRGVFAWMAGSSPAMTERWRQASPGHDERGAPVFAWM